MLASGYGFITEEAVEGIVKGEKMNRKSKAILATSAMALVLGGAAAFGVKSYYQTKAMLLGIGIAPKFHLMNLSVQLEPIDKRLSSDAADAKIDTATNLINKGNPVIITGLVGIAIIDALKR